MKKSIVVASLVMMGSALMAADMGNGWFMGTEFGGMDIKMKATASSGGTTASITDTMNTTYESLKIGKYIDNSRLYTAINYQNKKDDFSSWTWGLGYDYLMKNSSSITPFIGANVSYIKGKVDDMPVLDKPEGFAAGIEAGFIYTLSSNTELEAGIRYMNISNVKDSATISGASVKMEGKTATQYYLGINYKF